MNLTYEEIFNYIYHYTYQKIIKNKKTLDYLNSNPFISEKSVYKYMMNIWLIIIFYIHHI